ncbi:MAG: hypothetical protein EBZ47_09285 [Chlamydiae bacterium]|nr:hypothetical protein [Chlamydiota bacterium]
MVHLKEKNISIYNLFPFKNFDKIYSSLDFSILKFILNDLASKVSFFRTKFYTSKKTKNIAILGLKIIEQKIKQKTT